jgi:ribonuclease HII
MSLISFDEEIKKIYKRKYLIGVDEAGRGPLAGPVVAGACVYFRTDADFIPQINDSKKLSSKKRDEIFKKIISSSMLRVSFSYSSNYEIDRLNILNATIAAMRKAVIKLMEYTGFEEKDVLVIVDGNKKITDLNLMQIPIVKGDLKSLSIATASVFAKVIRDRWMNVIDILYPYYQFKKHKGYPTKLHMELIKKYGLSPYHRRSFSPCCNL